LCWCVDYNAIDNVLTEAFERYEKYESNFKIKTRFLRVRSQYAAPSSNDKLEDVVRSNESASVLNEAIKKPQTSLIIGGTYAQLGKMAEHAANAKKPVVARWFDLLIIDEASQMKVANAGGYFVLLKEMATSFWRATISNLVRFTVLD
jgi:hypothetical protein